MRILGTEKQQARTPNPKPVAQTSALLPDFESVLLFKSILPSVLQSLLMGIPLLVSIPPQIRGESFNSQAEDSFQARILASWFAAGFEPVSINTRQEFDANSGFEEALENAGVTVLSVEPSKEGFPDYLPNLLSLLCAASQRFPDQLIAITNADIHISLTEASQRILHELDTSLFLLAHRCDVSAMSDLVAIIDLSDPRQALVPYNSGIDFIAFHSSLVPRVHPLLSSELTIGLPWWDLILPLALQAIGLKRLHLDASQFLHLNHTERWSWEFFDRIGRSSTQHLSDAIQANPRVSELALSWFVSYRQMTALRFALGPKDLIRRLLFLHHPLPGPIARPILFTVAAISESFVMNPLLLRQVGCGAGGPKSPSA